MDACSPNDTASARNMPKIRTTIGLLVFVFSKAPSLLAGLFASHMQAALGPCHTYPTLELGLPFKMLTDR